MMKEGNTSKLITGLVAGALVGAAIGLLAAPKPGDETRKVVRDKAGAYFVELREKYRKSKIEREAVAESNGHLEVVA